MPARFDSAAEDAKLAAVHEKEEEDLTQILAGKHGMSYIDLSAVPVNMDALRIIPEARAREAEAVAFDKNGKQVLLALHAPENLALAAILDDFAKQGFTVERYLVSRRSIEKALSRYQDLSYAHEDRAGVVDLDHGNLGDLSTRLITLSALRDELTESTDPAHRAQVSKVLEQLLAAALALKASDIHIEPEETGVRLRFRLDGLLTDAFTFDAHEYQLLASRIKLLSGLKLNVKDRPQDGRFTIEVGNDVEVRTSVIPGAYGESIVLRILNPDALTVSFESLGIHPSILTRIEEEIRRPNGMLLTTGPTGSGKTTTLYTFLKRIHTPGIKIVTIEDPVEYHLPGIVQTQVDHKEYTFASGLRSILRQDPDVIMVGEIRDAEVAEVAVQAALTGHFVFSTLHTNNAAGTFPRLVDLGVDPKSLASAVSVAMAQRLVRKLDPERRKQVPMTDEEKATVERVLAGVSDQSLIPAERDLKWVPDPQSEDETGYKGRTGLFEVIFMDDELGTFLRDNPSEREIAKHVKRQGTLTMAEQGVIDAVNGVTSLEEVLRTVDIPRE